MDWKRRRWGRNAPFSKRRGICAGGGNSGINLLAQRFQIDPAFRKAVMKGNYRYSNGALAPGFNNGDVVTVVGPTMPQGFVPVEVVARGGIPYVKGPSIRVNIKGTSSIEPRRTYERSYSHYRCTKSPRYNQRLHRFAPKNYPQEDRGRLRGQRNQRRILLDPGSSSIDISVASVSGSVEGLLNLILYKSFGASLSVAMQYLGVTIENLAFESHIDDRKIRRLKSDILQSVYREDVLAIVIGLHLPPPIGEVFFQNAKIYLGYHDHQDVVYHMILGLMSQSSVDEVNAELRNAGLKEIPRGASRRGVSAYLE